MKSKQRSSQSEKSIYEHCSKKELIQLLHAKIEENIKLRARTVDDYIREMIERETGR